MTLSPAFRNFLFKSLSVSPWPVVRRAGASAHDLFVICLHRVTNEPYPYWPAISPQIFDEFLTFAKRSLDVVLFKDLDAERVTKKPKLILSFDDGFHDFSEFVLPILGKHGLKANLNVIGECVLSGLRTWNIQIYDFLTHASENQLRGVEFPLLGRMRSNLSESEKHTFGAKLSRALKVLPHAERLRLLPPLAPVLNELPEKHRTRLLSRQDILQAASEGNEIGSHSHSHDSMEFQSMEYFREDFEQSKKLFSNTLNLPLNVYAFPNGSGTEAQSAFLFSQGIKHVLRTDDRRSQRGEKIHPRLYMRGESTAELKYRLLR